jgi:hypothetical protein
MAGLAPILAPSRLADAGCAGPFSTVFGVCQGPATEEKARSMVFLKNPLAGATRHLFVLL